MLYLQVDFDSFYVVRNKNKVPFDLIFSLSDFFFVFGFCSLKYKIWVNEFR